MEHYILVNPVSGKHKGEKYGNVIQKLLKKYNIDSKIILSEYPKHLTAVTKELSSKSKCRFYSVGGDGTLNEVISGMIGTNSDVVVVPCGTGNDFLKSISKYKSMRKIILSSIGRDSSKCDVLKIGKDCYSINILSVGFDAMVGKNVDIFRKVPFISGSMKYSLSIFYTLLKNQNFKFKVRTDNETKKGYFTLIAVANGKYYGGGVCPCPNATIDDGLLDICEIDATSLSTKIKLLPKYKKGEHTSLKQAKMTRAKNISIVSTRNFPINIDGEILYKNRINISLVPEAINVVTIL
jgi:YegS/Rv2252/BmrU family lipid kinase